ncbi:ribonuclease P protein component [Sediminibacter sp. Hel_I_10]|uniref:ribonuclease P protein component n=1 Tax=Sediminibacter sp. Hel_I_10 TaxID=1392490 RepID=UPI000479F4C9|nr:ribonuclease P protein component [Sediminibacter sp. Hel_I_10]
MSFSYTKKDKLKSKKMIERIFSEGQSVSAYPLRMVYLKLDPQLEHQHKAGVSVSKRHFKRAVDRNQIKRLMREAYRLNKAPFFNNTSSPFAFMILYIGKEIPDFNSVEIKTKQLLDKFSKKELSN